MNLADYLSYNWNLLVLLGGILLVLWIDIYLDRKMAHRIALTALFLLIYSITYYIENCLGDQEVFSPWRPVLSAFNYSLITLILVLVITVMFPMQRFWLYFPCVLNAVLCFISIPTGIVFSFDKAANHFLRGPLGYLPYFLNALYMLYLFCRSLQHSARDREDFVLIVYMTFTAVLCLIVPLIIVRDDSYWLTGTIAADVLIYFVFLLFQYTKRDPLTKLLNRQSYFADAEKYDQKITAVVMMDMNGLKELNDSEGHAAGDTALKSLADCFVRAAGRSHRIYRMGGDEYTILCMNAKHEEVRALAERIAAEVEKVPYSCSVGYALRTPGSTVEQTYHDADEMMYVEKRSYYEASGKGRKIR